jgi:hypothetical protein
VEYISGCWWCTARVSQDRGNLDQAYDELRGFVALPEALGHSTHSFFLALGLLDIGRLCVIRSDLDAAEEYLERGLAVRTAIGDRHGTAQCWIGLAEVAVARGDHARAARLSRQARRVAARCGAPLTEADAVAALCSTVLAGMPASLGRVALQPRSRLAHKLAAYGLGLARRHTMRERTAWFALLRAEVELARGAVPDAKQVAGEALNIATECGFRRHQGLARRWLALCALAEGHPTEAEAGLRAALSILDSCGADREAAGVRSLLTAGFDTLHGPRDALT